MMSSATGQHWPDAVRPLELRRRARVIANFAEYLAEEVRGDPNRALEAMDAIAEWCEGDEDLLHHAAAEVMRDERQGPLGAVEINRGAVQLLALVDSASY